MIGWLQTDCRLDSWTSLFSANDEYIWENSLKESELRNWVIEWGIKSAKKDGEKDGEKGEKKDDTEAGKEENAEAQDNVQATESEELDPDAVTLAARAFRSWLHSVLLSSV